MPDLYADETIFAEKHDVFDEEAVVDFYVLDRDNMTSVAVSVAAARENARAIRHLISTEMWTHLNIFHNMCRGLTKRDVSPNNLSRLCDTLILNCQSFEGIAEGTFLRGEAWTFYQLGKGLERADQTTRVLDMGYNQLALDEGDAVASAYWSALLRSVSAYHAFRMQHPGEATPADIADFLIYDQESPRTVSFCVAQMTHRIRELERRHGIRRREAVEAARRDLEFLLATGLELKLTPARLHKFLDKTQRALGNVSNALGETYFQ